MLKIKCIKPQGIQLFLISHANEHSESLKSEDDNQSLALPAAYPLIQDNWDYPGICAIAWILNSQQ